MSASYKLLATYEATDAEENVTASIECRITYSFDPGRPMVRYERNGDPGHPADPAEWDVSGVDVQEVVNGRKTWVKFVPSKDPCASQPDLLQWARDYLDENDGERVYEHQRDVDEAGREWAAEQRAEMAREDALLGRHADEPF